MMIVISQGQTKREIKGAFHICMSCADMAHLRDQLTVMLDNSPSWAFGWHKVEDRISEPVANSAPRPWEA